MSNQEQHQERVLKVLQTHDKPLSVDEIAVTAGLNESDVRWACQVLQRRGKLTTVPGGNYELVGKKPKRFRRGELQEAVITLIESSPGRSWTAEDIGVGLGISNIRASEVLSRSKIAGKIRKAAWGLYESIEKPEERKPQFELTSPPEEETVPPVPKEVMGSAPNVTMTITVTNITIETAGKILGILKGENVDQGGSD